MGPYPIGFRDGTSARLAHDGGRFPRRYLPPSLGGAPGDKLKMVAAAKLGGGGGGGGGGSGGGGGAEPRLWAAGQGECKLWWGGKPDGGGYTAAGEDLPTSSPQYAEISFHL